MHPYSRFRAVLAVAVLAALALSAQARADTVTEWNQNASEAVHGIAGQGATSIVHVAMVQTAVYDAVNAIDRRHEPYVAMPRAKPWYSQEAAAATAAYRVLVNPEASVVTAAQFPSLVALIQPRYDAALARIPDGPAKAGGIAVGEAAAGALLQARANDGRFGPFRFPIGTALPQWRPEPAGSVNDPGAWLKDVQPFLVETSSQFGGKPPLELTSRRYAKEFNEVNRVVADQEHGSLADNARLFALAYTSAADALITTWTDKDRFAFWRPLTAIRLAAEDGNDRTQPADAQAPWTPLINAPPYPEHPSGLASLGGALVRSLQHFYGTDRVAFGYRTAAGIERRYTRFSQVIDEIVDARVWSGIHFRHADVQGALTGERVAEWANRRYFRESRCHRRG